MAIVKYHSTDLRDFTSEFSTSKVIKNVIKSVFETSYQTEIAEESKAIYKYAVHAGDAVYRNSPLTWSHVLPSHCRPPLSAFGIPIASSPLWGIRACITTTLMIPNFR